jgi:hypothetical protein
VATRCLYIAAPGSVIVSNLVALLNIKAQASAISILGVKMGSELRNSGIVFRYFAINTSARVNNILQFRYLLHSRSRKAPAKIAGLYRLCDPCAPVSESYLFNISYNASKEVELTSTGTGP